MRNDSIWSRPIKVFEKEVFSHSNNGRPQLKPFIRHLEHTNLCNKGVFSFIIISQLWRPIKLKFSQVWYLVHMLRYTKWEDWSLTITKGVQCKQLHEIGSRFAQPSRASSKKHWDRCEYHMFKFCIVSYGHWKFIIIFLLLLTFVWPRLEKLDSISISVSIQFKQHLFPLWWK